MTRSGVTKVCSHAIPARLNPFWSLHGAIPEFV